MKHGFGLLGIYVQDIEKAKAFYTDFLGMQVVPENSSSTFVYLNPVKGTPIALQAASTLPEGFPARAGAYELNLEVDDLEAARKAWEAQNVEMLTDIQDMGIGRWFRAKGPEDQLISVYQMYS
ncbi:VOC family protein [Dictyobacter formicarum]|nr:VOC family protein [Dictyobacter formicarum]